MYNTVILIKKQINTHGVPQGSTLAPLLYISYVNDFSRDSDLLFHILFANDFSVLIKGHDYQTLIKSINGELTCGASMTQLQSTLTSWAPVRLVSRI